MTSIQSNVHFEALEKILGDFLASEGRRHAEMVASKERHQVAEDRWKLKEDIVELKEMFATTMKGKIAEGSG